MLSVHDAFAVKGEDHEKTKETMAKEWEEVLKEEGRRRKGGRSSL